MWLWILCFLTWVSEWKAQELSVPGGGGYRTAAPTRGQLGTVMNPSFWATEITSLGTSELELKVEFPDVGGPTMIGPPAS
jgi:hypothetical protein